VPLTKPYQREVFERLRQALEVEWRGDTLLSAVDEFIAPHYEIRENGLLLLDGTGREWTPTVEQQDGLDAPDSLTKPALPFPFSGHELGAFFLGGWGYFLGDRFAMLDGGPDEETMDALLSGARDATPRKALLAAGRALTEARQRVAETHADLARIEATYRQAIADIGRPDIKPKALRHAQSAFEKIEAAWRKEMVRLLTASAPVGHTETAEKRQERRAQMVVDAGLVLPTSESVRLPRGIAALAAKEGISKQAFSKDVKAHIGRTALKQRFRNVRVVN
jgi:hypothetical protein